MRKTLLPLLLSIMAFPVIAHAQLIDLAIYNSGNPQTPSGAAVLGESGDQWNIVSAPISSSDPDSLKNVGGGDTSVTFSTDLPYLNYNSSSYGDLDPALFDNFAFTTSSSATLEFAGLAKDTTYTLVLYSFNSTNNAGADFTYSVNGGTTYTLEEEPNAKFTSDSVGNTGLIYTGNYVELTTESDSSGDLDISLGKGAGNTTSYFGITGVQLEGAPEPSTWAMLLGGVFLLVFLRVRQSRA